MSANEPTKNPGPEQDTTVLHLNKFAPEQPPRPASDSASADDSLTAFIATAAAETCQEKKVVVPKDAGPVPPESMLGIVSYCYVKGVYDSSDIERKMREDPAFRASCRDEIPRPEDIRRFRRLNREAIQTTLEKFFRRARKKITTLWWPENPFRNSPSVAATSASPPGEETQVVVRREASDRLDKASFIDGVSF
jgi:hypothetical protein